MARLNRVKVELSLSLGFRSFTLALHPDLVCQLYNLFCRKYVVAHANALAFFFAGAGAL